MKYFLDTEFHECKKKPLFSRPIDTIELISIGIVDENNREYYAICKDFDLKAAWNSYQRDEQTPYEKQNGFKGSKVYWLRENVLKSIWLELHRKDCIKVNYSSLIEESWVKQKDVYKELKYLLNKYGKTREQIAEEIKEFVLQPTALVMEVDSHSVGPIDNGPPEFYAYYGATDWVNFYRIFNTKLLNLPKGFPWHYNELKQILDDKVTTIRNIRIAEETKAITFGSWESYLKMVKNHFPKQTNEHNALADAKWDKEFYEFLNRL